MDGVNVLPTKEELAQLPRPLIVAYAYRNAMRVRPLFTALWPDASARQIWAVDWAIRVSGNTSSSFSEAVDASSYASEASSAAKVAGAHAAALAASAAAYAAGSQSQQVSHPADAVDYQEQIRVSAAGIAASAAAAAASASDNSTVSAAARDLTILLALAARLEFGEYADLNHALLGPLWPNGEPEGWPDERREDQSVAGGIEIELDVDENATDEEVYEAAAKLAGAASRLHTAHGGHGLKIKDIEIERESLVREGVLP